MQSEVEPGYLIQDTYIILKKIKKPNIFKHGMGLH